MSIQEALTSSYSPPVPHLMPNGMYNIDLAGEEDLPEGLNQSELIFYLLNVLKYYYATQGWLVTTNLPLYENSRLYLAPDILVFKRLKLTKAERRKIKSWPVYRADYTPPNVVIEVSSDSTWPSDVEFEQKPSRYARLNIEEYFAYDPQDPQVWRNKSTRLRGWRNKDGAAQEIEPDKRNWLWSQELNSWLVADDDFLRIYDSNGDLRLTKAEAEEAAKEVAITAKEVERRAKETERRAKEAERTAKDAAITAMEAERQAKEQAWAKLRELGIDPESL